MAIVPAGTRACRARLDIGTAGRNAVAAAGGVANICCPKAPRGVTQGAALNDRGHARSDPRAPSRGSGRSRAMTDEALALGASRSTEKCCRFPRPTTASRAAGWCDLLDEARSGDRPLRRRRAAGFADSGDDPDRRRRPSAAERAGDGRRGRRRLGPSFATASAARSASTCRRSPGKAQRQADRRRRSTPSCPSRSSGPRSTGSASFRSSARARRASLVRAGRGPRGVRSPRTAPPRRDRADGRDGSRAHPAVIACSSGSRDWLEALARQFGGAVILRSDPSLPIHGGLCRSQLNPSPARSAASRARPSMRPSARRGCKDRDLLNWLGEGYRIPGPPADPAGVDSEERDG